jgi:monoamine oxidase
MAAALGDRVRLGAEAVAIEQDSAGVRVRLADGDAVRGSRAVLALPLTAQRSLRFDPPPPRHRREALARARYGDALKAALVYEEVPEGSYPRLEARGVLYRPDPGLPLVGCFAASTPARRLAELAEEERRSELGRLAGAEPRAFRSIAWSQEPFTRGSYLIFGPGDLTTWRRRLAEPHGRLHFAGSESSPLPSYVNGAILAGERAAQEVLRRSD